jgi:hypothetical protein
MLRGSCKTRAPHKTVLLAPVLAAFARLPIRAWSRQNHRFSGAQ